MALSNERAEKLAQYLTEKKEAGYDLLDLAADEAVAKINADGYDFTVNELHEFAEMLEKSASGNGDELDENSLDNVSGGVAVAAAVAAFAIGYYVYRKNKKSRW